MVKYAETIDKSESDFIFSLRNCPTEPLFLLSRMEERFILIFDSLNAKNSQFAWNCPQVRRQDCTL